MGIRHPRAPGSTPWALVRQLDQARPSRERAGAFQRDRMEIGGQPEIVRATEPLLRERAVRRVEEPVHDRG